MILPILTDENPILRKKSTEVDFNQESLIEMEHLINSMGETMFASNGIGLSAPQVGALKRLIVFKQNPDSLEDPPSFDYMINPKIISKSPINQIINEGCLSVKEQRVKIKRSRKIKVKYKTLDNQEKVISVSGLLASVIAHEIDHLDGKLITDYI